MTAAQLHLPVVLESVPTARYAFGLVARPVRTPWGLAWEIYPEKSPSCMSRLLEVAREVGSDKWLSWRDYSRMAHGDNAIWGKGNSLRQMMRHASLSINPKGKH